MSKMKYVWAAALLALFVGICAGGALAQAPPVAGTTWAPTGNTIPDSITWDQGVAASVSAENNSSDINWDDTFGIASVEGAGDEMTKIDRWGTDAVAIAGPVRRSRWSTATPPVLQLAGTYTWDFTITAPPIASLAYSAPIGVTEPPVAVGLGCNWELTSGGTLQTALPTAGKDVNVYRFNDLTASMAGEIQECAGRVPFIAAGNKAGGFMPTGVLNRGALAAFLQRAVKLAKLVPTGTVFSDVATTTPFAAEIETVAAAGTVHGYKDGTYLPNTNVNRGQMGQMLVAAFLGGSENIPAYTGDPSFSDVASDYGFFNAIEYGKANGLIKGYKDGSYKPTVDITRAQMATFLWRAFINPTDCVVVLAGPGMSDIDPVTAGYNGVSTIDSAESTGTAYAYVGFDAIRAAAAPITVHYALMEGTTSVAEADGDVSGAAIQAVKDAAAAAADGASIAPYVYSSAALDLTGVADGTYKLVTTINGEEQSRQVIFRVGAPIPAPAPETLVAYPSEEAATDNGAGSTIESGTFADLEDNDDALETFSTNNGGLTWLCAADITAAEISTMTVETTLKIDDASLAEVSLMTSGSAGATRNIGGGQLAASDTKETWTYTTANTAKLADIFKTSLTGTLTGEFQIIMCAYGGTDCNGLPGGTVNVGVDQVKTTFTLR